MAQELASAVVLTQLAQVIAASFGFNPDETEIEIIYCQY